MAYNFFVYGFQLLYPEAIQIFFLLVRLQALSLTIITTLVVTFFPSSSLKIPDTKCGSFLEFFFQFRPLCSVSSLTGIEDILVKREADHKRKKIIERSRQSGIEVSLFCRFIFSYIMQNF